MENIKFTVGLQTHWCELFLSLIFIFGGHAVNPTVTV